MSLIFFANSCMFWLTHGNKKACKYMIYRLLVLFDYSISGEGGIRTPGTFYSTPDFESGTLNRSDISPGNCKVTKTKNHS